MSENPDNIDTSLLESSFEAAFRKMIGEPGQTRKDVSVVSIMEFITKFNKMVPSAKLNIRDFYDPTDLLEVPSFKSYMRELKDVAEVSDKKFDAAEQLKAVLAYNYVFSKIFDNPNPDAKALHDEFDIKIDPKGDIREEMRKASKAAEGNYKHQAYEQILRGERVRTRQLLLRMRDLSRKIRQQRISKTTLSVFRAVISGKIEDVFRKE